MAKWFRRRKDDTGQTMHLQGVEATATRALYQGAKELPTILFTFKVRHGHDGKAGEDFDQIEVEMDLYTAGKFLDQGLSSYRAAMPRMPRIAHQTQYGE